MSELNLVELPGLVLEKVFSYSVRSLRNLTQCCSFLKNFIESCPTLMDHFNIKISIGDPEDSMDWEENLDNVLKSTKKYKSLAFHFNHTEIRINEEFTLKMILRKNENWLTKLELHLIVDPYEKFRIVNILSYLENLSNLEDLNLSMTSDEKSELDSINLNFDYNIDFFSYNFPKLKILKLRVTFPIVFEIFKNCSALESLNIDSGEENTNMDFTKMYSLLEISKQTLQSLTLNFDFCDLYFDADKYSERNVKILSKLRNLNIDVTYVDFGFDYDLSHENTIQLMNFLKSQKNLKILKLRMSEALLEFFDNFKDYIASALNLKSIELNYDFDEMLLQDGRRLDCSNGPWKLNSIDKIHFISAYFELKPSSNIAHNIFCSSSEKLKEIQLNCIDLGENVIANITRNYQNLTEFCMMSCYNYKSDDIFLIFKNLKKLSNLTFEFPDQSALTSELLVNNRDMNLPNIQKVDFYLNDQIFNCHLMALFQHIKITKVIELRGNCFYSNSSNDIFYMSIRELSELINLNAYFPKGRNLSTLKNFKAHIQLFNKNPNFFKIEGQTIDYWITRCENLN